MVNNDKAKNTTNKRMTIIIILLILIFILLLLLKFCSVPSGKNNNSGNNVPLPMDETQGDYVVPDMANFVSKNVTLPGWGAFNIPANTTEITKGFEFHNPEANKWYEVDISYNDSILENLIIDSDKATLIKHYVSLAGIKGDDIEIKEINTSYFQVIEQDGESLIKAINHFDGSQDIVLSIDGNDYTFKASCRENVYYMTFALYLTDGDELLYQSNLVAPGKYIQSMTLNRPLAEGSYNAYVYIQPYRADKTTQTNSGKVVIDLNVK